MLRTIYLAFLVSLSAAGSLRGAVSLGSPFTNDMVVQRSKDIAVWGKAGDGEAITVEFRGAKASTDPKDGKWSLRIPSGAAGGPSLGPVAGRLGELLGRPVALKNR